jgi:menaquinone-dependent protoporphyrinogen oxidase
MARTLIAYASEMGSTKEIAERLGTIITAQKPPVDVLAIKDVTNPTQYTHIILGSAIHGGKWLSPATKFIRQHPEVLSAVPVWAFSVGCPEDMPSWAQKQLEHEDKMMAEYVEKTLGLKYRDHGFFSGALEKEKVPFYLRWTWGIMGGKWGPATDWEKVESWGKTVADEIE